MPLERKGAENPSPLPDVLQDQLGFLLGRAHAAHRAVAEDALAATGLRGKAFGALLLLVAEGPVPQGRLGRRQGIDRTTTVAVVDELQALGYVERRRDPADRRAYVLHATARGRRILRRAEAAAQAAEEAFLAPLEPAERDQLRGFLRTLVAAATPAAGRPAP